MPASKQPADWLQGNPSCTGTHFVGGQQSVVWGDRRLQALPTPAECFQICNLKTEQGIPTPMNSPGEPLHCEFLLSFLNSSSPISHWQMEIIIPSSVCAWSIWPEQRPREQWLLLLLFNEFKALCQPTWPLTATPCQERQTKPLPVPDSRASELPVVAGVSTGPGSPSGWNSHSPCWDLPLPQMKLWGPNSTLKHNSVS